MSEAWPKARMLFKNNFIKISCKAVIGTLSTQCIIQCHLAEIEVREEVIEMMRRTPTTATSSLPPLLLLFFITPSFDS